MSTADLTRGATDLDSLAAAARGLGGGVQPPSGLPDVAVLTKLANAFFAAVPGQSLPVRAGPSSGGFGASPMDVAGSSAPHMAAASTSSAPTLLSTSLSPSQAAQPAMPSPFDAAALDERVLDALIGAAVPSPPSSAVGGPSLPGFGGSPIAGAGLGQTPSPPLLLPLQTSGGGAPQAQRDVSVLDLGAIAALPANANAPLPQSIDAGPSLSGVGLSHNPSDAPGFATPSRTGSLPGATQTSAPQPPPANAPPQVLGTHSGIDTPRSGGTVFDFDSVPLPFESELKSLLAPLAAEPLFPAPATGDASPFYFLDRPAETARAVVPGASEPKSAGSVTRDQGFDVQAIRRDFPILNEKVNGRPLIWFDNAATTQKPRQVIDRISYFYEHENSNIHRAAHELAARSTDAYEGARTKVARFLNAGSTEDIIFTRGTTEAINLVAATYGGKHVGPGDEIVITNLEHHANIVPWQQLCLAKGAKLRIAPVDDCGALLLDEFGKLLNGRTKIVAFTQVSNALGTITPAKTIVDMAHRVGARVLVDGAQSVSHMKVDVQDLDADFFVFSGHKLFGPTGIGVVYGKKDIMDTLPPYQTGGNMIRDVTFEKTQFHDAPMRFEAGTGNIADAVGLGAAIDYVERIGLNNIADYEHKLLVYATERLLQIPNLRIIGRAPEKASVISLVMKGIPSEEVGARLNKSGIAVRSGHHCAQPILRRFGQETTVRPSFAFYNTCGEIDVLVGALRDIQAETGLTRP